jgi:hypothetical protein
LASSDDDDVILDGLFSKDLPSALSHGSGKPYINGGKRFNATNDLFKGGGGVDGWQDRLEREVRIEY